MGGKTNRRKGHNWEREVANDIRTFGLDPTAKRHLEYQEGGGMDIETKLPLTIQCKCGGHSSVGFTGLHEAIKSMKPGSFPVCALKVLNKGDYAIMTWNDFLELFANYWRLTNK